MEIPSPEKVANNYPHQLSGGMSQRVVIATAIIRNPELLIADEPTTALDATIQLQILQHMKEIKKKFGSSLLLITHDLGIAAELCDKVYIMYAGKIVEFADVFTVFRKPKHPYTIGLLDSALSIEEFKKNLVTIRGRVPNLINPPRGCRFHPRCPIAREICTKLEPPLIELEPRHMVSCRFCEK